MVYGISDLHLSLDLPDKTMEIFGDNWKDYMEKIRHNWESLVKPEDIVIVAGDVSWQLKYNPSALDLEYLKSLPGRKVLVRGNHDYWWRREATNKIQRDMPENIYLLMGRSVCLDNIWFCGTRGWRLEQGATLEASKKIFERETTYFKRALEEVPEGAYKVGVLHYPPFNEDMSKNAFADIAREEGVNMLVYGHIHGGEYLEGNINGVEYRYIAADGINVTPKPLIS